MNTASHWTQTASLPHFPALDGELSVDVAVVGGGITGITTAYLAKRAGLQVALLEKDRCAQVDTGHTTAHLTAVTDVRLHEMRHRFSADTARMIWEAGDLAIDRIEHAVRDEAMDCGFERCPGHLYAASLDEDTDSLLQEAEVARDLGVDAEFLASVPFFQTAGVRFPHQAMFHPLRYLAGLLQALKGDGAHVFEKTPATKIDSQTITTPRGKVRFRHVVIATHNPLMGDTGTVRAALFQSKLSLCTSYALSATLPPGLIPRGCYWDTHDPYHYLRVEPGSGGRDFAVFGGEDHRTGQVSDTIAMYERLEQALRQFAPLAEVQSRWSGQVIETNDGLPFIGPTGERQFVATGFSGNGLTFGTFGAMMAIDWVRGVHNPWDKLLDPHRRKIRGGTWAYLKANKDYPYYFLRNRLAPADADSLRDVAPGEGRIVEINKRKLAAYRDPQGRITLCSAVCTHMGCLVGWNPAEKTWDCPAHGARFHTNGEVLSGPAEEPLTRFSATTGKPLRRRHGAATH